jgi:hypothetical protein
MSFLLRKYLTTASEARKNVICNYSIMNFDNPLCSPSKVPFFISILMSVKGLKVSAAKLQKICDGLSLAPGNGSHTVLTDLQMAL